jgi:hypothetical protein
MRKNLPYSSLNQAWEELMAAFFSNFQSFKNKTHAGKVCGNEKVLMRYKLIIKYGRGYVKYRYTQG